MLMLLHSFSRFLIISYFFWFSLHSRSRVQVIVCISCNDLGQSRFYLLTWVYKIWFSGDVVSSNKKKSLSSLYKRYFIVCSSTKANYQFVMKTFDELNWVCSLFAELDVSLSPVLVIYFDGVRITNIRSNPFFQFWPTFWWVDEAPILDSVS